MLDIRILYYKIERFKKLIKNPNVFDFILILVTVDLRDCAVIIRRGGGAEKLELSSKNLDSTPPPKQKKLVLAPPSVMLKITSQKKSTILSAENQHKNKTTAFGVGR